MTTPRQSRLPFPRPAVRVLVAILRTEGGAYAGKQEALAARVGVHRTTIARMLAELRQAGKLETTPHPQDRRLRRYITRGQ